MNEARTGFQLLIGMSPRAYSERKAVILSELVVRRPAAMPNPAPPRRPQPPPVERIALSASLDAALRDCTSPDGCKHRASCDQVDRCTQQVLDELGPSAPDESGVIPVAERKRAWMAGPAGRRCKICRKVFYSKAPNQKTCGTSCGVELRKMTAEDTEERRELEAARKRGEQLWAEAANGAPAFEPNAKPTSIADALAQTRANVRAMLAK